MEERPLPVATDLHLPGLDKTLHSLSTVLAVPWMLVGALARDLRLYLLPHPPADAALRTKDADIGVYVATTAALAEVREGLVAQGWKAVGGIEHKLLSPHGVEVDVVPFGGMEAPPGRVAFDEGSFQMNVTGYQAALKAATWVEVDGVPVRVVTLPFYTLLKCLAWDDRRDLTRKDAEDLARVFDRYEAVWMQEEGGQRVEAHLDLFDAETDTLARAARVLGRETRRAAEHDSLLTSEIARWLSEQEDQDFRRIVAEMGSILLQAERRLLAWKAFERGWNDPPQLAAPR